MKVTMISKKTNTKHTVCDVAFIKYISLYGYNVDTVILANGLGQSVNFDLLTWQILKISQN